jgi:hypothetical protein
VPYISTRPWGCHGQGSTNMFASLIDQTTMMSIESVYLVCRRERSCATQHPSTGTTLVPMVGISTRPWGCHGQGSTNMFASLIDQTTMMSIESVYEERERDRVPTSKYRHNSSADGWKGSIACQYLLTVTFYRLV